ncbi:class I SAM-dependent methyltransferase [Alkalihalobacillus sp. MEB130]|uniref:class I SAM-dependent methyltransferase n=1 Tax=Alkalihalobacillus sp. MEB130 TaxID=2976704 RepID=UPI0028DEB6F2|nr:class I SAM-dependent methyltransferase [Alkalihalobacillus sp. MEB130]MDT8861156.1 class I SAM-dependent methyltransferase [Alkalihalobacillus sp. MEB130]
MKKEDIFHDNMDKYLDPEWYDLQYDHYLKDFPLILRWAKKQGGTIADLACGTGRVTIPLALEGFSVIGVDLNEGMLNRAKEKTKKRNVPIKWILQDCTNLRLDTTCSLIYTTGNSFQHFLTNESQNQLLQSIHSHLEDEGIFIFGTRFPNLEELMKTNEWSSSYYNKTNQKVIEKHREIYHPLTQILKCLTFKEILNNEGEVISVENERISLRFVFPMEMERLLNENGFSIIQSYGDWEQTPLQESSGEMIYVCKKY